MQGERPEVPLVEVHLMDFEGEIYGEHLELQFVAPIRAEQRFPDLEVLREQIARDVELVRRILGAQDLSRAGD